MGTDGREGAAWIKARGGRILTEAEESCVVYGMPRSVVEAGLSDAALPIETHDRGDTGATMRAQILIVDDSGLARRRARAILEAAGFEVIEAEDGMAALESYFVSKPDVVLLDLVMKGMYGLDVLAKLREMDPPRQGHRGVGRRADLVARAGRPRPAPRDSWSSRWTPTRSSTARPVDAWARPA